MPGIGAADWHYLDAENYNPLQYSGGELPWAVEWIFDNIVQYLKAKNWGAAENLMGAICHFAGDSTQPLHSTWNYDPNGLHSAYETTALNAHIGEISIPDNYLPQELDNVLGAALASLAKSFSYTAEGANPGDNNLTAFLENGITWNSWIKSLTENRLRSAVQFTANLWYSAMIQAGFTIQAPNLTSPSNGSSTSDNTPTFTWTSVSGTSSYDFQLASDNNFTINAVTVKGLATTSYTPVTPLTNGVRYWHVRTGDNSADVGLWSQTQSFTVSVSTQNPVVVISPISQSGANGATLTYTVTVSNTENASDNFNLTASDNTSPSWGPTVSPTSLTIPAGENRTSTLSVTVPSSAIGRTIDNITVAANGTAGSGSGSCTAQVNIARGVNVSISPSENHAENGQTVTFIVTVKNMGNNTDNYDLTVIDNDNWGPTLDNNSFENVLLGENRTTTLRVVIPDNAPPGTYDNITVTATSRADNTVRDNASCIARAVMENAFTLDFVVGWNLVGFTAVGAGDTPNNLFPSLTYLTDYRIIYWQSPGGPYSTQPSDNVLKDNTGYWVWINRHDDVTMSGTSPATENIYLENGWNLVCFPVTDNTTTPNNLFPGLTYLENYRLIYWQAPGGPYKVQPSDQIFEDNTGYWVWIDRYYAVTVP